MKPNYPLALPGLKAIFCFLFFLSFKFSFSQLPPSICSPIGGKRPDILSVLTAFRAPAGAAPTFTIPAGATSVAITISSHSSIISTPTGDQNLGDEDFITITAILNLITSRSSGFLNYAQSTNPDRTGTNLYSWIDLPFGTNASTQISLGQSAPILLNDVRFNVSGSTLTITETSSVIQSSYMVEFTSATSNSLLENGFERVVMTAALASSSTAIPVGTNLIVINRKGTVRKSNYASGGGTEEGYADSKLVMDLDNGRTNGFVTVANGANIAFRSTYCVVNHPTTSVATFVASGNVIGDFTGKSTTSNSTSDIGISDPAIYVSAGNLIIDRSLVYRTDFDDVYVIEFYRRTGLGMSVEFIETQSRLIAVTEGTASGTARILNIPAGAEYIILKQAGNANNAVNQHNENSLAAYAVINLKTEKATGYFYQQVGFGDATTRRDDNYGFKDLPLDGTSSRNPTYSLGIYYTVGSVYDLRFTLSADKSKLTVTNSFGLVANNYQLLTNADFFGARPDFAFTTNVSTDFSYANNGLCGQVAVTARLCNPGAGNSPGGIPVAFYSKNPTTDGTARLLYLSTFNNPVLQATCSDFVFNVNLKSLGIANPNIQIFAIANDNGSFVPGGVGNTVVTPFSLASLSTQGGLFKECDYTNNIVNFTIAGVMPCSDGLVKLDANGLTNTQIDGAAIGVASAQQLYVNVLNAANNVVFTAPVNTITGAFDAQPNTTGNFTFQLSTNQGTVGMPAPVKTLPAGWVNTGENNNTGSGSDLTANGLLPLTGLTTSSILSTLLGIQREPTAFDYVGQGWANPGGTGLVNVPTAAFNASDPEDGVYTANITGRKVTLYPATGALLYYNGILISSATTIPVFNNDSANVDPAVDGNTSMTFPFTVWDNADFPDPTSGIISMGFGSTILPSVGLVASGYINGKIPVVTWTTLTETNTRQFVIERSSNGVQFSALGLVAAAGTSNEKKAYSFTDNTANTSVNYYRIKLVDNDGKATYSNIVNLSNRSATPVVQVWPNPVKHKAYLFIPQKGSYQIDLFNPLGILIMRKNVQTDASGITTTFDRNTLPAGMYVLKVTDRKSGIATQLKIIFE